MTVASLPPDLVEQVARRAAAIVLAELRGTPPPKKTRDLASEAAAFVEEAGPATVPEIAAALVARHADVRAAVKSDPRFFVTRARPGRSPKEKPWAVASSLSRLVPSGGTSTQEQA